ncbi:MAG: hypothetical protein CMF85_04085 [Candidatus Marinimicrobia bacterium]|nr:hypothetical protein [Candidatus Neomarinimicrobiota bacterium]MBO01251.1 hypothetical protein [Candidatus Neomarinimicrobiota bacterium]
MVDSPQLKHLNLNLPYKTCPVCGRPFSWRKKWRFSWNEVRFCSEKCRRNKNK